MERSYRRRYWRWYSGVHWEYPLFCIIVALYIPILSGAVLIFTITTPTTTTTTIINIINIIIITLHGAVLIFTGLRIRATLRRKNEKIRNYQNASQTSSNMDGQQPATKQSTTAGTRRTLKIVAFTSVAFFLFWSPNVVVTLAQMFFSSFKPPAAVEFTVMWLANTNSAVNVFIYSSTNTQFRRQCVLLASRLHCSRLSCLLYDLFVRGS